MRTNRRILVAIVALVATIAALHILGARAGLALADWSTWTTSPAETAIGALRLLALAFSYYLLAVAVAVVLLGERLEENRFARFIPYGTMAAAGLVAGVGLLGTTTGTAAIVDQPAPLVLQRTEAPLTLRSMTPVVPVEAPDVVMGIGTQDPVAQPEEVDDTWVVKTGESFWTIAAETLEDHWGVSELTDTEIVSYWKPLIAANEDRLVDPGNPDLLLPDQELILPPTPEMERGVDPEGL